MSPTRWNVLWNTGAQVIGRLVGTGTMFIVSLVLARNFGVEGYGDFTKITTFVALFYLLADFGMNAIYLQASKAVWGELLGVRVVGSVILILLALVILVFIPHGVGQGYTGVVRLGIIVFLPTILFQAVITTTNAQFQHILRYHLSTIAVAVGSCVTIFAVWIFVRIGVIGAVEGIGTGSLVTAVIALFFVKRSGGSLNIVISRSSLFSYFTRSLPLATTLIFNLIYIRADHLILTLSRSTAEVGIYGLAYKVFELPLVIPTFFMNSVYPLMLATLRTQDVGRRTYETKKLLKKSFIILCLISFVLSVTMWFAAPLLTVVRPEFAPSISLLRILTFGLLFFFLSSLAMWTLIAFGKQMVLAFIYGCLMVVTILADVLIIPTYGAIGAAWVTVVSEACVLLLTGYFVLRIFRSSQISSHET